jgi:hypothetical protein
MEYIIKLTISLKGNIIRIYYLENIIYLIAITYKVITMDATVRKTRD